MKTLILILIAACVLAGCATTPPEPEAPAQPAAPAEPWVPAQGS